jgi:hypothetical protein
MRGSRGAARLSHLVAIALAVLIQQEPPAAAEPARPGATMAPVPDWVVARPVVARTGVTIDAYDPRVEAARTWEDGAYDATVRNGAALAQSRQGRLDGGWTLTGADGAALFSLEIADRGEGVEGVWRALDGGERRWGFLAPAYSAEGTTLRLFATDAAGSATLTLQPALDGTWRGQLTRNEASVAVVMRRK